MKNAQKYVLKNVRWNISFTKHDIVVSILASLVLFQIWGWDHNK